MRRVHVFSGQQLGAVMLCLEYVDCNWSDPANSDLQTLYNTKMAAVQQQLQRCAAAAVCIPTG